MQIFCMFYYIDMNFLCVKKEYKCLTLLRQGLESEYEVIY